VNRKDQKKTNHKLINQSPSPVLFYSHDTTSRLKYIAEFIGREITGASFQITDSKDEFKNSPAPKINYSDEKITEEEFFIRPHRILFEKDIKEQAVNCFDFDGCKAFFETGGDLSFDIFAASFYLLSRYEEYLPHEKDEYGRYAHKNSLAFKEKFLRQPLVNIWIDAFRKRLKEKFSQFQIPNSQFRFVPTYDIDEAWAYKHKSFLRTAGGMMRSMMAGQWAELKERRSVLNGAAKDEYDSYEWMDELHKKYQLTPVYFFHVASSNGRYDKNILPSVKEMQDIICHHSERYDIGVHPSWQSGDQPRKLKEEILRLGHIAGKIINSSRQHYIRFNLPVTFRQLIDAGIHSDYSMGYGSINGFRASTASPFYWYDLENESQTELLLFPFCYMDANSFFEQKLNADQAFEEMMYYFQQVRSVNAMLITIWHNSFLGTAKRFKGWKESYEKFISLVKT
jgi:hypothetical protein